MQDSRSFYINKNSNIHDDAANGNSLHIGLAYMLHK